jgi:predicted Na+-dependent transporter
MRESILSRASDLITILSAIALLLTVCLLFVRLRVSIAFSRISHDITQIYRTAKNNIFIPFSYLKTLLQSREKKPDSKQKKK